LRIAAKGKYIGAPCNELKCDVKLLHVSCDKESQTCSCERNYPVQLGLIKGCAKRKWLRNNTMDLFSIIYLYVTPLAAKNRANARTNRTFIFVFGRFLAEESAFHWLFILKWRVNMEKLKKQIHTCFVSLLLASCVSLFNLF